MTRLAVLATWTLALVCTTTLPWVSAPGAVAAPFSLRLEDFRTPVSPGTLEEDTRFLADLIPQLAKNGPLSIAAQGDLSYESLDVKVQRLKSVDSFGKPSRDATGRTVIDVFPSLEINGETFKAAALEYLSWRKTYEEAWIRSATGEDPESKVTPLARIFNTPTLNRAQKVLQTVQFYRIQNLPVLTAPTSNPKYWPVSPILELESLGVQVQFNLRGGHVIVLQAEENRVWMLPFPHRGDPELWLDLFESTSKRLGISKATEVMKKEVLNWNP